jgi:hypothetical protein
MATMTRALIGRDHPAGILRAEIGRAVGSHGGLVLVTGEAGIGKTTLVTAAAEDAQRLGALVLSGSCWDSESAPGYWPWVQVIRALRRAATDDERTAADSVAGNGLAVLLGEAADLEVADDFRIYDAVTTAMVAVSQHRPVVVVLEDLHWADAASLKLLEFAAQHTWFERLLLIGTYRDVEVETTGHPLRPLVAPLLVKATTVTLTGLGQDEVGALMASTVGREPEADLAAEVHRRTGGNPFFVEQTARLWHSGGSVTTVAPGVREAVRRRLSLLPNQVVRLLVTGAVLGREFHRQVLASVAAQPVAQVDRWLDEAIAARLVASRGAGAFAFAHDLVREALYDSLDEAEVRRQHAAVVRAMGASSALAGRLLPADLARHAYLAGDELEPAVAVDHLLAAARDAGGRMATLEAIGHYRRAYQLVDQPRRRVMIGLDLAGTLIHITTDAAEPAQIYRDLIAEARKIDDDLLARVALSIHESEAFTGQMPFVNGLLEELYDRLIGDGKASVDRIVRELTVRAAVQARRNEDDEALGFSLWARHHAIWGPGSAGERLALTRELLSVAQRTDDREMAYFAASFQWVALVERGDPRYYEQYLSFLELAKRAGMPLADMALHMDSAIIATMRGQFDKAQAHIDELYKGIDDHRHPHFLFMVEHTRWELLVVQGRFDELPELHQTMARGSHPAGPLVAAIAAVHSGNLDPALRHLAEVAGRPDPYGRFVGALWARYLAQTAAASGDQRLCEQARAALEPYAGDWLISMFGADISGPAALWLGMLDAAQERWDDAVSRLTQAYESADALAARPWSIEARLQLGAVLLARGEAAAGAALLAEVEREAAEIGMRHIGSRVRQLRSTVDSEAENEFRRAGDVWTLRMGGRTVHMPDTKGLRDLHTLIGQPGLDIPAVELLDPSGGALVVAARRLGGDAVLDDEAKARYKGRLAILDEEIDRAESLADDRRAAVLDQERAALLEELRTAAGLAGRTRRLGDESERARKTVTARIRDTLRKLDDQHPELAAHLRKFVSTGLTCRYHPTPETPWRR